MRREYGLSPEQGFSPERTREENKERSFDEVWKEMREARRKLGEVVPENRNFNVEERYLGSSGYSLSFTRKDGVRKDLAEYLPKNFSLGSTSTSDRGFRSPLGGGRITYDDADLKYRSFPLAIFHEIGHANTRPSIPEKPTTKMEELAARGEAALNFIKDVFREKEGENKKISSPYPERSWLPEWYLEKMDQNNADVERKAWAWALKELRHLEKDGFEVFAGFKNVKEIQAFIASTLYSHEMNDYRRTMSDKVSESEKQRLMIKKSDESQNLKKVRAGLEKS